MFKTRAEIALRFQTSACNSRAAAFVLSTLLKADYPYFPALLDDTATQLFSMHAAELAVIEIQITEQMLTRWMLIHPTQESACDAATEHLWRRLAQIRDKARGWAAAHEAEAQAAGATSASKWRETTPAQSREQALDGATGGMDRVLASAGQAARAHPVPDSAANAAWGGPMPVREGARDGWRDSLRDRARPRRRPDVLILRPDRHSNIG